MVETLGADFLAGPRVARSKVALHFLCQKVCGPRPKGRPKELTLLKAYSVPTNEEKGV